MSETVVDAVRAVARLARLLERGCDELSLAQYRVLCMVKAGGERASFLADRLAVAKPTVTAAVDTLVERDYLHRTPVPGDRRAARITITPEGRRAVRRAEADMVAGVERVLEHVEDRDAVVAALASVGEALDQLFLANLKEPAK
ncbi:MAG TPA: MarR family transcriptional regulator [Acidimicrobiales bacterium]|nr:MarR family transcriptional regulator [Acidimicrobiales bacterium]